MRSPITYVGGKGRLVSKLLALLPPHRVYVEVFGGAGWLLFAKNPSPVEVYNDINGDLVNLFRVIRDPESFGKFLFKVSLTPYSRQEWRECNDQYKNQSDPVERAYMFFVTLRQAFGGKPNGGWGFSFQSSRGMADMVSRWLSAVEELPSIHARLSRVLVENNDFRKIIKLYDSEETFFYCDPPYVMSTRRGVFYEHEMTDEDHEELLDLLLSCKARWMLSGYQNPIYAKLEKYRIKRIDFPTTCHVAGRTRNSGLKGDGKAKELAPRIESVWLNYTPHKSPAAHPKLF